jgi:para-nitrobenzyl esterase
MPSVRFAEAHAAAGGTGFMYRFDLESESGPFKGYAPHAADLQFIFGLDSFGLGIVIDKPALSRATHALWARWAKAGMADLAGAPPWRPYTLADRATLLIADPASVASDPRGDERALWDGVI